MWSRKTGKDTIMNLEAHLEESRRQAAVLKSRKHGVAVTMVTAYDYPTARLLDEVGVDTLLVGDSLGMMVMGYPDTTSVSLADMVHHISMVARAGTKALVIGDMPINTYRSREEALDSALPLLEAGAQAVKLEGGVEMADCISALVQAGIPVVGHVGLLPQRVKEDGGYKIKGKTEAEALQLEKDILAVAEAGAFLIVVEGVKADVAARLTKISPVPTIGIGSGANTCDGEVVVISDLIGCFPWFVPGFVKPRADVAEITRHAVKSWKDDVQSASMPKE